MYIPDFGSRIFCFLPPIMLKYLVLRQTCRIFDHCTIFLLIAGTYSPVCLIALRAVTAGWWLFYGIWGAAAVGILCNAVNMHNSFIKILSQTMYLVMGWCAVLAVKPLIDALPPMFFLWIGIGGLCYTGGVLFYAFGRKVRYFHPVWHLFCLAGTITHFVAILFYVIMA